MSTPAPVLAESARTSSGLPSENLDQFTRHPLGIGGGEVDLVEGRDDLEPGIDGHVGVGESLGLHPLGGVGQQQGSLAGRQRSRHLV